MATKLVVIIATTPTKRINIAIYFENLVVGLHVLYVVKTHIKFCIK